MAGLRDVQLGSHCHRKTWINILLRLLQLLLPCVQQGEAQLQALRQMSTSVVEVWQPEDAEPMVPVQVEEEQRKDGLPLKESSSSNAWENGKPLHFQPPAMEFQTQPLGLPRAETIYIHNPSQEFPVTLLSVFTSSRHFHMPSFHKRVIPPRGKAAFKLVFLPLEEGNVENTLFINTSAHGVLSYQIFGVGVHRGASKSVHRKDSLLIFPHIQSIKLTQTQEDTSNITILGLLLECSVSKSLLNKHQGSCLQSETSLTLHVNLSERGERPGDLDKLKPYILEHILVLLMAPAASAAGDPKIGIYMLNSGGKKLYIKDMQVLSKVEAGLEFNQLLLKPEAKNFTQVATVECRGSSRGQGSRCSRHVGLRISANLTARTFPGLQSTHRGSGWDLSGLVRARQSRRASDRVDLWLTNPSSTPLTITSARLSHSARGTLKVADFAGPLTVRQGCWRLLSLQLLHKAPPVRLLASLRLDGSLVAPLRVPLLLQSSLGKGEVVFKAEAECGRPCPIRLSEAGRAQWQRSLLPGSLSPWTVDSGLAAELCSQWQSNKEQLPCRWPRLPLESSSPLDFGATPVNESKVKPFTLKNPSSSVVSVEISALSQYPAPLDALDLLTRWFNTSPLSVNISTTEFTLLSKLPKDGDKAEFTRGQRVLRLLLQPWETREVAVVFTPSEHKPTSTILIIRNNLTVLDMAAVRGHGAKELLRVGGKLPGPAASLRFNVPQATLMECRDGLRTNKPLFAIRKSFRVENGGELPLTVMSMNINGYQCQGFGFEVLQCRPFSLHRNASSEITIAFTPDFTSSWVIRDLTLVTSRGSSFPFTLNVTLPHHMLPLCAQVVPGPSWEETFWMITLVFTCFSLFGVCLMAFHQAQYILNEFFTPGNRNNHNSALSRHKAPVNSAPPSGVRTKGGCKNYVDGCHTSDKGKGRGSAVLAGGNPPAAPPRPPSSRKTPAPAQPQKKHRVSLFYAKHKPSGASPAAVAAGCGGEEEQQDLSPAPLLSLEPEVCNHNNNNVVVVEDDADPCPRGPAEKPMHFKEAPPRTATAAAAAAQGPAPAMFPMETPTGLPHNVTVGPGPRPGLLTCSLAKQRTESTYSERRESAELEPPPREDCRAQKKKAEPCETGAPAVSVNINNKGKKSRRKASEGISGVPEHSVLVMSEREKDPEWRPGEHAAGGTRVRARCPAARPEAPKPCPSTETPAKQNACLPRPRRKCAAERRGVCESGSESGSSSGSVRASRGSWGSWSSTSSLEGEKDPAAPRGQHPAAPPRGQHPAPPARRRDPMQYNSYPAERDCYQNVNTAYKAQSMNSLYCKDQSHGAQSPGSPGFVPSFASVTAGVERTMDLTGQYVPEETWSAPSVPLTNDFRYNASEALPAAPQPPTPGPYHGFPWNSTNSQCGGGGPYGYCEQQDGYMNGNGQTFPSNAFPCQESPAAYGQQPSWSEDCPQETSSVWERAACVGSKPYFHGTRSLSPMSSLFGSIWTPQSEPYQSHFQADRSAPVSPVAPVAPAHAPFSREPGGSCRPPQYPGFNPFGPHMNLDIWNSSSNRSSNSQLSNDSGYCGDV